jgi:hypothetical protein
MPILSRSRTKTQPGLSTASTPCKSTVLQVSRSPITVEDTHGGLYLQQHTWADRRCSDSRLPGFRPSRVHFLSSWSSPECVNTAMQPVPLNPKFAHVLSSVSGAAAIAAVI